MANIRESIGGVVDVKLAQFLSNFGMIIGEDVAAEFLTLTHDAPTHPIEYSKAVVEEDFGDKYCLKGSTLVGSGSIAQIHKLAGKDVVIKVVHPHAKEEIEAAVSAYTVYRDMWMLPSKLKVVCDVFFDGLESQLDMRVEARNAIAFPASDMFVCPQPLDASNRCLVMRYESSCHLSTTDATERLRCDAYHGITKYCNLCLEQGLMHADMHEGNFGIRYSDDTLNQIVIYDFGLVYDLRGEIPESIRKEMCVASEGYDFERYKEAIIKIWGIDEYDTEGMDLTPSIEQFTRNMECFVLYYFSLCKLNHTSFKLMSSMEKYYPYASELVRLERNGVKKQKKYS